MLRASAGPGTPATLPVLPSLLLFTVLVTSATKALPASFSCSFLSSAAQEPQQLHRLSLR